jgi:hypothetical protein
VLNGCTIETIVELRDSDFNTVTKHPKAKYDLYICDPWSVASYLLYYENFGNFRVFKKGM